MAALDLRPDVERGGPRRMGAGPRHAPRQRVKAMTDRDLHELVPRRMELHLIDAVAEDARKSGGAIALVLSRPAISSLLVDNLNAQVTALGEIIQSDLKPLATNANHLVQATNEHWPAIMRNADFRNGIYDTGFVERLMNSEDFEIKPMPARLHE